MPCWCRRPRPPYLPARHEVPELPAARPGTEPLADRRRHVRLRLTDGVAERLPARQPRGDRRREGAAGAVGVARFEARAREAGQLAAVPEDVRRRVPQVAALDENVAWPERQ